MQLSALSAFILCYVYVYKWENAYIKDLLYAWRILMIFFLFIWVKEGGGSLMHVYIYMGTHSLSYRTYWWMLTKLGRDEVIMAMHMRLGFSARPARRWIQGCAKISQWGAPSPKDFFFRSECNSNKPNASLYPELKYCHCLLFGMIS